MTSHNAPYVILQVKRLRETLHSSILFQVWLYLAIVTYEVPCASLKQSMLAELFVVSVFHSIYYWCYL
jgi:hypothetical protein